MKTNYLRWIYTFVLLALLTITASAQNIAKSEADINDYIKLLNNNGYVVKAFDFSSFEKDKYLMSPVIMNHKEGRVENLLEDFPIGFTNSEPRITISLAPQGDSISICTFQFDKICKFAYRLKYYPVIYEDTGKQKISYHLRPFDLPITFNDGETVPLISISSSWYDADTQSIRNCDAISFGIDYLESNTFKYSPHIYVIGVKIKRIK